MRRPLFALLVAVAAVGAVAGPATAQRPKVKIDDARVGLPAGGGSTGDRDLTGRAAPVAKRNTWAPVYVRLEMLGEYKDGGANLKVETTDGDDLKTTLVVPLLPTLADRKPGEKIEPAELPYIPYARVGDRIGEVVLTVLSAPTDGSRPKELSEPYRFTSQARYVQFKDPASYVVLGIGSRLPTFDLPAEKREAKPGQPNQQPQPGYRDGRVQTAILSDVREMPDQWFGYGAADLVVLGTGAAAGEFLDELFDPQKSARFTAQREALFEWVRRGGKLLVSVGANAGKLVQSPVFQDLLPLPLSSEQPSRAVGDLPLRFQVANAVPVGGRLSMAPRPGEFAVARFGKTSPRPARVLLATADPAAEPVVTQVPFGLGKVTAVGFDLDRSPFAEFPQRAEFWDWLLREAGTARTSLPSEAKGTNVVDFSRPDREDELAGGLRQGVDSFEGVPVISFGWVALFIVLYTLLIGPVEYFFLKKVVGRLELTWVTFPLIVLTVSAGAYLFAYAIKGNDLKLNKVDLVDVDLRGGRVYGRTWFTLFSPRIESYTVGVEPRAGWAKANPEFPPPAPLVDWMAGGRGGGGGSIISRGYSYNSANGPRGLVLADGLRSVPVQVWSTKAFTGQWVGEVDKAAPPVKADLAHPPASPGAVAGSLVCNLPVGALAEPVLVYAGKVYKLPALAPGQTIDIPALGPEVEGGLPADPDWFTGNAPAYYDATARADGPAVNQVSLWRALFHERAAARDVKGGLENASLRDLDLSWRLTEGNRDEAILLVRVPAVNGPADQLLTDPAGPSATTLWLKGLPGEGARTVVPGTLRQETYIRVFIPIPPAAKP